MLYSTCNARGKNVKCREDENENVRWMSGLAEDGDQTYSGKLRLTPIEEEKMVWLCVDPGLTESSM